MKTELHAFSDASNKAYAAVIYMRSIYENGQVLVRFVASKTKIAPVKTQTIPRLELLGAVILARLVSIVVKYLPCDISVTYWVDFFFAASTPYELQKILERDFSLICNWYSDNRLTLNIKKTKFLLAGSKLMLSKFEDFKLQSRDGIEIDRTQSFKYLGVKLDEKWSWKPHIKDLFRKLGHRLSVFNRINHMLDHKSRVAYFNGLVLPHLDYAVVVWGNQVGVKSEMEQLQAFQNRFAKKIQGGKQSSFDALKFKISKMDSPDWTTF